MTTTIPTEAQYLANEQRKMLRRVADIENAPLADRREARKDWSEAIAALPEMVAERVGWLLDGNYGKAEQIEALACLKGRGNSVARLSLLIALFEWNCPNAFARAAWRSLSAEAKAKLDEAVRNEINRYKAEQEAQS